MSVPEILYGMNPSDYHSEKLWDVPHLSASVGKPLVPDRAFTTTPLHVWASHPKLNPNFQSKSKKAFDIGNAAHELCVGRGRGLAIIDADDYMTKKAREARDDAYAADRIPVLSAQNAMLQNMAEVRNLLIKDSPWGDPFANGKAEVCLRWEEKTKYGPIMCKALVDWLYDERPIRMGIDYKTTGQSAHPMWWERRQMTQLGMDISAAFHIRGYRALGLGHDIDYLWVVQEFVEPYACSIIGYDYDELRETEAEIQAMIDTWAKCLHSKKWPGYDLTPYMAKHPKKWGVQRQSVNIDYTDDHVSSEDIARTI